MSTRRMTTGGRARAAQAKKAAAAAKEEPTKAPKTTAPRRSARRAPKSPEFVDSDSDYEAKGEVGGSDEDDSVAKTTSDVEPDQSSEPDATLVLSSDEDDAPVRQEVEITPKRVRMRSRPTGNTVSPESPSPQKSKTKPQPVGKRTARDGSDDDTRAESGSPTKKRQTGSAPFKAPPPVTPKKSSKAPDSSETFWTATPSSKTKADRMFTSSRSTSRTSSFVDIQDLKGPLLDEADLAGSGDESDQDQKVVTKKEEYSWADPTKLMHIDDVGEPEVIDVQLEDTYGNLPSLNRCVTDYGAYPAATQLFSNITSAPYDLHKRGFKELVTFEGDGNLVVNLARTPISNLTVHGWNGTNKQLLLATPRESRRVVCMSIVVIGSCKIVQPGTFMTTRTIKQLIGFPLRGEWERSISALGTVFREDRLAIPTFREPGSEMPRAGVVFRTRPEEEAKSTSKVFGLEATPTRRLAKAVGGGPAAGLRAMADKMSWGVEDDIPIWDARPLFEKKRLSMYKDGLNWANIQKLDRVDSDLNYGDIGIIFYMPSTYASRPSTNSNARSGLPARGHTSSVVLSLNLCGVALVADKPEDD